MSAIEPSGIARAWWQSEWGRHHARRWQAQRVNGYGDTKLFPVPLPPLPGGPRILPPDNESVKTIRALEAITINHVPLKETAP